jgi:small subunit ribosomal protein S4
LVKANDVISIGENSKKSPFFQSIAEDISRKRPPAWAEITAADLSGKILRYPTREEIDIPVEEHLIVELYSR